MPVTNFPTVSLDEPSYPALFYLSQGVAIIQVPSDPENNVFANAGSLAVDGAGNAWIKTTDYANTGWVSFGGGGGGTLPGGANRELQFNDNLTAFGGLPGSSAGVAGELRLSPLSRTGTAIPYFRLNTPADFTLTATLENVGVYFGGDISGNSVIRQWTSGAINKQREFMFIAPTYSFTSPSTISTAATVAITGPPIAGTNAAITTPVALYIEVTTSNKRGFYLTSTNPLTSDSTPIFSVANNGVAFLFAGYDLGVSAGNYVSIGERVYIGRRGGGSGVSDGAIMNAPYIGVGFTAANSSTINAAVGSSGYQLGSTAVLRWTSGVDAISGVVDTALSRLTANVLRVTNGSTGAGILLVAASSVTASSQLHVVSDSASRVALQANSAAGSSVAIAKFLDNTTDLYNFELSRLKIDKGTAFDIWLNTNAGAKSNFRVGATSGLHPGNAYGFILPYIGGSQSDGPGIYWTDGSYGATVRLNLNLGLNWQGCGGVTPFRIRKGTDNSSDGDVIFDFRPNDANFSLHPYGTGGGQTTPIIFRELAANGTNYVGFKSPDAITNDCVWVLPSADGKANQSLFTDGSKNLSWDSARLPYAELYEDNGSTAITITTAGTFYQWQSSTIGSFSNCSPNATNDNIVPDTNYSGTFQIAFSCSVTATANATIQAAVFVNGSRLPEGTVKRKVNASGDIDCLAIVCIAAVAAGQTIDARFTSDTNGDTITPIQCNLSVVRIGA